MVGREHLCEASTACVEQPRLLAAPLPAPKSPLPPSDVHRGPGVRLRGTGPTAELPPELQEEQAVALALADATEGGGDTMCAGLQQLMPGRLNQLLAALEEMGLTPVDDRSVY